MGRGTFYVYRYTLFIIHLLKFIAFIKFFVASWNFSQFLFSYVNIRCIVPFHYLYRILYRSGIRLFLNAHVLFFLPLL